MYRIIDDWLLFNIRFNKPLSNVVFPIGIQKIEFGWFFNQDVSNLPNSLTHLYFGIDFNQDVSNLPNRLIHLSFDYCFNQDVSQLPNSLTYLTFGKDFNQDVSQLPKSLTYLGFDSNLFSRLNKSLNPYLYQLTGFKIYNHKHNNIMIERCKINQHNISIREDKLIDLLLKN